MNERQPVRTVLCGIGGYGEYYLGAFLELADSPIKFVGFVDPFPERAAHFARIKAGGTPIYPSLEAFYARAEADLAILASPIQYHAPQTLFALERGSHVLCEKPLCATVQDARRMLEAERRAGRVVAVGYQDSYTQTTQRLKADILAGAWGRPVRLKGMTRWPRSREYYGRNAWAGRLRDADGRWVLDSPVNNATAHYLHHMLYLLGDAPSRSAVPLAVEAQLYRAYAIENYDTAFIRCAVAGGAEVVFITSHASAGYSGPTFEFVFERGTIRSEAPGKDVIGTFRDGSTRNYGLAQTARFEKVYDVVAAIREGREPLCGIEAAMSQTLCMNGAQDSGSPVVDFPRRLVREVKSKGEHWLQVAGLDDLLLGAYRDAALPDASTAAWVRPSRRIALDGYEQFPSDAAGLG